EVEGRDDEEEGKRVMVRVGRLAPRKMADAQREEEGSDDPRLSAERLLREGVCREDREGAEEAGAEQEDEGDSLPRRREERGDQRADEEREPGQKGGARIVVAERM